MTWLALVIGCDVRPPEASLERMVAQESVRSYEPAPQLPGGVLPGDAPPGTQPYGAGAADPRPAWTEATLVVARADYERLCAVCHGLDGRGDGPVAPDLALRHPPSLLDPRIVALPDRDLERVVREGYGLMPRYGDRLDAGRRWGVVGYLRALMLSQSVRLAALPADEAARVRSALEAP
ncbi:MAG: cytochrome c [Myxococcota bacterium]